MNIKIVEKREIKVGSVINVMGTYYMVLKNEMKLSSESDEIITMDISTFELIATFKDLKDLTDSVGRFEVLEASEIKLIK